MSDAVALRIAGGAVGHAGRPLVSGIDLELPRGSSLALVGTNGSGKSTLIRTLVGLLEPCAGRIEVLGAAPGARPARIGYLGQFHTNSLALPIRAGDIVRMGRFAGRGLLGRLDASDRDAVDDAVARMGVADLVRRPLRELSGGQQQRIYIAQALARRADLLLLDEPAAGLDAVGRRLLSEAVETECARGAAVIVATHDIGDAMRSDYALLLARRVVACGRSDDVLSAATLRETFGLAIRVVDGDVMVMDTGHGHGGSDPHVH